MRRLTAVLVGVLMASEAHAQKTLTDGIKDLATQISTSTTKEQKRRVAVLPFKELDGQTTVLGTYLAEELLSDLVNAGLKVVERGMLDKLLGEQRLQQTGAIDPATAKQVGKVAGVDAIITGTVTDLQSIVGINCRLIDTTTGDVFAAAQTKITKDDDVKKILAIPLASAQTAPVPRAGTRFGNPTLSYQWDEMRLVIDSVTRSGNLINITFAVESSANREEQIRLGPYELIDENGERWSGKAVDASEYVWIEVTPGTRRRVRWNFNPNGDATGSSFTLVLQGGKLLMRGIRPK